MPPKSTLYNEVGTKDPVANVPELGQSASRWTKKDLDLLGVEFQYDKFDEIGIRVEETDIPPELLNGRHLFIIGTNGLKNLVIENYVEKIKQVDMTIVNSNDVSNILDMLQRLDLEKFEATYLALATLLARLRRSTQNMQIVFRTPPTQTTLPVNPKLSGGSHSSKSSNSSSESKGEPYAQSVAMKLLDATFITTARWTKPNEWVRPEANLSFFVQYASILLF